MGKVLDLITNGCKRIVFGNMELMQKLQLMDKRQLLKQKLKQMII